MNISVIIPTLNEESTIASVVETAKKFPKVDEVIVVDDHSVDDTVLRAKLAGASVLTSTKVGKGASMREGLLVSKNEIAVFLDGDIGDYEPDVVEKLVHPLLNNEADFVKSTFERVAGRVTELVAKPLLSLLFPEVLRFPQPLSGVIAGKREFLGKTKFEDDHGVDVGILLDMIQLGARITEVNIGKITHKMKQWQQLGPMSREVARVILKRAQLRPAFTLDTLETISIVRDQMESAVKESLRDLKKMVILDLDNTLFMGRFIDKVAEKHNFQKELVEIVTTNQESFLITKLIARLLRGLNISHLLSEAEEIPMVSDAAETIAELKKRGYIIGIISDGYKFVAQHVANKTGVDFVIANELDFANGVATGEVKVPSCFAKRRKSRCNPNFCKSNAMLYVAKKYNVPLESIIAVGDSEYDICMVKYAGIGVAFCSDNKVLNMVADRTIETRSFKPILDFAP
ncbi:MAG: HAD-IB family phosphatase [Actinomycetota bacterium]|nr:HAD-IB family phosphatase [Actinomycetota bacterium]